jgi:hypothetical protein
MRNFRLLGIAVVLTFGLTVSAKTTKKYVPPCFKIGESVPIRIPTPPQGWAVLQSPQVPEKVTFGGCDQFDAVSCELVRHCPEDHKVVSRGELKALEQRIDALEKRGYIEFRP